MAYEEDFFSPFGQEEGEAAEETPEEPEKDQGEAEEELE